MTTAQFASYDQIKQMLLYNTNGMFKDDSITHFLAGSMAGFVATVVCSPVDVVKTKIFFAQQSAVSSASRGVGGGTTAAAVAAVELPYRGMMDCFVKTWKQDGLRGFFKGFSASFIRYVIHLTSTERL